MREYVEFLQMDNAEIPDARIELNRKVITDAGIQETGRLCPRCRKPMRKFNFAYDSNIILDRCPSCGGIWADRGEVFQMATYIKGNPRLNRLGLSVLEDSKEAQAIKELANFGKDLSTNASWFYFPKIILPIGDDIETSVFPATVMCLVLLNLGIFLCQTFCVLDLESFVNEWGLIPVVILSGEGFATMISSVFLHGNILHLAGNMFFLWIFGDNVEEAVGHIHFLGNYLIFGLTGGVLHIVASPSLV
jgi:Zn-finger nucleic acid-binding protein